MKITYTENDTQGGEPLIQMSWWERAMIMDALKKLIAATEAMDSKCLDDALRGCK